MSKPHASGESETQKDGRCEHPWVVRCAMRMSGKRMCLACGAEWEAIPQEEAEK